MWRNTGQPVRVLMLDARACLPILSAMVYWSWTTLYIAIAGVIVLLDDLVLRVDLPAMLRLIRRWLVGSRANGGAGLEPAEARMSAVNVEAVGRTMRVLLEQAERPIVYRDPATGTHLAVDPQTAVSPAGFLPAFRGRGRGGLARGDRQRFRARHDTRS